MREQKWYWAYQWQSNRPGEHYNTCRLYRYDGGIDPAKVIVEMLADYGQPEVFTHELGPGIMWPNGGSWGIWVLAVEARDESAGDT